MVSTLNGPGNGEDSPMGLADKCGCIPLADTPTTDFGPDEPDAGAPVSNELLDLLPGANERDSVSSALPRGLKLVVTLDPAGDRGYRALLAVGAAGCDPLFRSVPAESLDAALAAVPALLAEAATRWQTQPRYPAAAPAAAPRPRPAPSVGGRSTARTAPQAAPTPAGQDALDQTPAGEGTQPAVPRSPRPPAQPSSPAGQLSLFG